MKRPPINRVELLHALNEWCAGAFNPLIAFPNGKGFHNIVYLYDSKHRELLEKAVLLMEYIQHKTKCPVMAFVEPLANAPKIALTYKQWIEAGDRMKAIELVTNEQVYVLPVYDDNGNIIRYVSSDNSYAPGEIKLFDSNEQKE